MQASELRIGNIIGIDGYYDNLFIVIGINEKTVSVKPIDKRFDFKAKFSFDKAKPIPLTEEWLLKFGFELILWNGKVREYYRNLNEKETFAIRLTFGEHLDYPNRLDKVVIGIPPHNSGSSYGKLPIQYIHQLQNLYFALAGKDLIY